MRKLIAGLMLVFFASVAGAQTVTVAALGDSLTHGYGLQQEDGFVPQLNAWLTAQGADTEIVNAGVSGDTTAGGAARVAWTLTPETDAMIVALGGNDFLRGVDPQSTRQNLSLILETAASASVPVLLIGFQAPGNFGPDYKSAFDAIYPDLAAEYGALFLDSFFVGLPGIGTDPQVIRDFFQADGLHPNAAGVAQIVEGVGPKVLELIAQAKQS